jgi:hypothetical protein
VHNSHAFLSQPTDLLGKGKGFIRRKGWRGMLGPNIRKGCKTWAEKGKGFWQILLALFLVVVNDTSRHLFI